MERRHPGDGAFSTMAVVQVAILIVLIAIANYLGHIAKNTAFVAQETHLMVESSSGHQFADINDPRWWHNEEVKDLWRRPSE